MRYSMEFRFLQYVGIKRLIPTVLGFFVPAWRKFFAEVEEFREEGRKGRLDLEDSRNMCVLDGIFSMGYATILGLVGGGVYYLVFEFFGAAGGAIYLNALVAALMPFMATALVEIFDFIKVSLLSFFLGEKYSPKLAGPLPYLFLFIIFLASIFYFFRIS